MNDQDLMRKIGGLLAKAEGTDNEAEAAAFFEKAQEMMVKHAIDEATLREARIARDGRKAEAPVVDLFMFATNDAHSKGRAALLDGIARANHVRVIQYRQSTWQSARFARDAGIEANKYSQWCRLVGFAGDIERVKLQYASLSIQWARLVRQDTLDAGLSNGEAFGYRTGHLVGFASRVRARMAELAERIVTAASATALMVNKGAEVEAARRAFLGLIDYCMARQPLDEFDARQRKPRYCIKEKGHDEPHAYTYAPSAFRGSGRSRAVDYAGYSAGKAAGDRADIGLTQVGNRQRVGSGT